MIKVEIPSTQTTFSLSNRFFANQDDLSKNEEGDSIDEFVIYEEEYSVIVPEIEDALTGNELIWSNVD